MTHDRAIFDPNFVTLRTCESCKEPIQSDRSYYYSTKRENGRKTHYYYHVACFQQRAKELTNEQGEAPEAVDRA